MGTLRQHRGQLVTLGILLLFAAFSAAMFYYTPTSLVGSLGVSNAYLFLFIIAALGGVTTFSNVPYHLVLIGFALGGLSPVGLGLSAACGVMLGDSTSYYLGYRGHALVPERYRPRVEKLAALLARYPRAMPASFFVFGACIPISNDFLTIPMGIARYPFLKLMLPLWAGNIVFNIALGYAAVRLLPSVAW